VSRSPAVAPMSSGARRRPIGAESDEPGEVMVSEISERYRRVAGQFTERVKAVPDDADEQTRLIAFTGRRT